MASSRDQEYKPSLVSKDTKALSDTLVLAVLKDKFNSAGTFKTHAVLTDTAKKMVSGMSAEGVPAEYLVSEAIQLKALFFSFAKGEGPYMNSTAKDFNQLLDEYQKLLKSGVDVKHFHIDVRDADGNTLLMVAASYNNHSAAQILLNAGANIHLLSAAHKTAFMLANAGIKKLIIQTEKNKIAKILFQYSKQWRAHPECMLQALDEFLGPALNVDILDPMDNTARLLALLHQNELAKERKDFAKVLDDVNVNILIKLIESKLQSPKKTTEMKLSAISRTHSFSGNLNTLSRSSAVLVRPKKMQGKPDTLQPLREGSNPSHVSSPHHKMDEFRTKLATLKIMKI